MSRVPIRLRLTAAFAAAMLLVLVAAGAFVYLRLEIDLNDAVNTSLSARASELVASPDVGVQQSEEALAQIVTSSGRVVESAGGDGDAVLTADEAARAARGPVTVERRVAGIDGDVRVLAQPASMPGRVAVVGQSLEDRDEALGGVVASFAIGGAIAVVLASAVGYALAAAGLAPVEAMRRRAASVSLSGEAAAERLPLPAAHDEVRRLGETLNAMLDRLQESFDHERRFVADASHELRTPVAVIKAELEAAIRMPDLGPQAREALVAAVEECDHLAQLAEDLLVIARAEGGALPVRPERLDAAAVLEGVRVRFGDRAAERDRAIAVSAPAGLSLQADPMRLAQALGNLVDNALRHGEGEVRLQAAPGPAGFVSMSVADRGPGFSDGVADEAFERFARGPEARPERGAGLGLAIVRAVADAHGGTAEIVADGTGATVVLTVPAG